MSKEKQIEDMAKITAKAIEEMVCKKCEDCKWNGSGSKDADCTDYVCAEALYNAGYRKQSDLTPCDVCRFNPPTSGDGKPCTVCPAQAKGGAE